MYGYWLELLYVSRLKALAKLSMCMPIGCRGSGRIAPHILKIHAPSAWRQRRIHYNHQIRGSMGLWVGFDVLAIKKKDLLFLPAVEPLSVACSARSLVTNRLWYPSCRLIQIIREAWATNISLDNPLTWSIGPHGDTYRRIFPFSNYVSCVSLIQVLRTSVINAYRVAEQKIGMFSK